VNSKINIEILKTNIEKVILLLNVSPLFLEHTANGWLFNDTNLLLASLQKKDNYLTFSREKKD